MPNPTLEYRCLLISPSDVTEERDTLTKAVAEWNAHIGKALGARVELVRWESHAVPDLSAPPQDVINRQIVNDCDMGLAVFWSRVGTPTDEHPSGSVEEIVRLMDRGARVMVYFSERPLPPASSLDAEQIKKLQELRARFNKDGLLATYSDTQQLRGQVNLHLTSVVAELLTKETGAAQVVPPVSFTSPHDKALIAEFVRELPSHGEIMQFLREWDLGGSFPSEPVWALERFVRNWSNAEHEFEDPVLEQQRSLFLSRAQAFVWLVARNTVPRDDRFLSIGMDDFETRPEMFDLQAKLNDSGTEVYQTHQELIRLSRRRLGSLQG